MGKALGQGRRGWVVWSLGLIWLGMLGLGMFNPPVALAAPEAPEAPAIPEAVATPAALFELHCAGCHPNGSNIVRRGKSLQPKALKRHGVDSVAAIATLITQGKGLMSAYGDRLTPEQIQTLAEYVWQRSQAHWKTS
ncbi:MAG: c-type cytochrome [Cyanobacteria bacterium]|nr:c-type cytochrome [Cyanobacteriota bacterium]MDA0866141.1 c-type cytochrome [Cyanobacteriota bacterium]